MKRLTLPLTITLLLSLSLMLSAGNLWAHSHSAKHKMKDGKSSMMVDNAWVRAMPPTSKVTAGYLTLHNMSDRDDALIGVSADFAGASETHNVRKNGEMMEMFPVEKIVIPSKGQVHLKPGSFHLMFLNLKRVPKAGEMVTVDLMFEMAGKQSITFMVKDGMNMPAMDHSKH